MKKQLAALCVCLALLCPALAWISRQPTSFEKSRNTWLKRESAWS
jgi:hypothetical protein